MRSMYRRGLMTGAAALAAYAGITGRAGAQMQPGPGPAPYAMPTVNRTGRRRKLCVVGDSYAGENANFVSGTNLSLLGCVTMLNILSRQAFVFNPQDVFATSGGQLANIIAWLPSIIAGGYDYCVIQGCHNDQIGGRSLTAIQTDYKKVINTLLTANIIPIICSGTPNDSLSGGSGPPTLAQVRGMTQSMNAWKRAYCEANFLPFWDWFTPCADLTSSAVGGFLPGYSPDTIHPGVRANWAIARQGLVDLAGIILPPLARREVVVSDIVDPTWNPYGNLLSDAGMFWNGGGTLNNGATGTLASGWNFFRAFGSAAGGSVVCNLVPASDGLGNWQQFAFSGTTTGGINQEKWDFYRFVNQASGNYSPGDVVEFSLEVNVVANSPFGSFSLTFMEQNKDNSQIQANVNGPYTEAGVNYAWSGVLKTAPMTIPADSATGAATRLIGPGFLMLFDASAATGNPSFSGTVQIRNLRVSKVPPS